MQVVLMASSWLICVRSCYFHLTLLLLATCVHQLLLKCSNLECCLQVVLSDIPGAQNETMAVAVSSAS